MKCFRITLVSLSILFSLVGVAKLYAAVDYFTAQQDGNTGYVKLVEKFHIDVVPKQIKENELRYAIGDLSYALDRVPNHPVALQLIGVVAQLSNQSSLAVERFRKAIDQFPQYALTYAQYGLFLVAIRNFDDGINMLKQSIEIDPKLAAGYAGLAHAYSRKGDFDQARDAAKKARELGFSGKLPDGL